MGGPMIRSLLCIVFVTITSVARAQEGNGFQAQYAAIDAALDTYESAAQGAREEPLAIAAPVQPVVALPVLTKPSAIKRHDIEGGFETYMYRYEEISDGVHFMGLKGRFDGFFLNYIFRPNSLDPIFCDLIDQYRVEGRMAWASVRYDGGAQSPVTGATMPLAWSGIPDSVMELRVLAGKDLPWQDMVVTPYAGFGARLLTDDATAKKAVITDGVFDYSVSGYKRHSEYVYIPIGMDVSKVFSHDWKVKMNAEFDYLLYGKQKSDIATDTGSSISNSQTSGYGLRGSLRLEKKLAYAGLFCEPFVRYWNIAKSKTSYILEGGVPMAAAEPKNTTKEIGMKMGVNF
ncbi:MAG: hypothetical protein HQL19_02600 [Candidatus Omnitrophica bacterium]|nr:hypothetical protein [Candidatus Omnitrophota bacterium]